MKRRWVLGVLLVAAVTVAATSPVAMRVEIEPLRQLGDKTEVAVIVQVAPMDRGRIGSNAIVRIELDEGRVSSGSPMRAVKAGEDGSYRITVAWPPGEHDLRVTIEDSIREDTGLWVGKVRIPDLGQGAAAHATDESKSVPIRETRDQATTGPATGPVVPEETAAEPTPAPKSPGPQEAETMVEEAAPEPPATATVPVAAVPVTLEASTPPTPAGTEIERRESAPAPELEPTPEAEPKIDQPVEPEPVPAPEPVVPETPTIESEAMAEPEAETPPTPEDQGLVSSEVAGRVAEETPLVEPLRAEPQVKEAVPEAIEPGGITEEPSEPVVVSGAVAARYAEWEQADPDTREFSVVAMRGREPARDLDSGDIRLRVDGSEMSVQELGDERNSPLLLGLAIDVFADNSDGWADTRGSLAPIVERAAEGRGRFFVASSSGIGDWNADADATGTSDGQFSTKNVAGLVEAALERFTGQRGRSFLVVLTDGRNEPTKDEWRQASDAAGEAGVPILVVALWDSEFSQRTRKNLKKLTVISGGSLFLVQGRTQIASAADRFGRYLDGGYAVRFRMPLAQKRRPLAVSVSATDHEIAISAPESIR